MIIRTHLSDILFSLILFFLVVGRLESETLGIKIGGKIENLAVLVFVACFLSDLRFVNIVWRVLQIIQPGLFILVLGLVIGLSVNFSGDSLEELLRMALQALIGFILGYWIYDRYQVRNDWLIIISIGCLYLLINTPWTELKQPELEGSFGHRNLQSAFYVLSFPLLMSGFLRKGGMRSIPHRLGLGMLLLAQLVFVVISRSRSGLIGFLTLVLTWLILSRRCGHWRSLNLKYVLPGLLIIVGAIIAVSPRFVGITNEIGNPYHLSRSGVWSAALEGFKQPQHFVVGVGMGEGYFKTIQESPMGNLNQRYRRGHHPHSLFLQWLYWGGIFALMGWFWILTDLGSLLKSRDLPWQVISIGASLAGFVCLELFETTLKNGRIHTLFWLNVCLLILLYVDHCKGEDRSGISE